MARKVSDDQLVKALREANGVRAEAARLLNVNARSIMARIGGLKAKGFEVPDSTYNKATLPEKDF